MSSRAKSLFNQRAAYAHYQGGRGYQPMIALWETDHNRLTVYLERQAATLAGTCAITVPKKLPILGGFGEVATRPELRGGGIATRLWGCRRCVLPAPPASSTASRTRTSPQRGPT